MLAKLEMAEAEPAPSAPSHKIAFFRQSGWLMVATILGGLMSLAVHPLSKLVPDAQYSIFGTLMMVTVVLPTMPLQMIYAQQTAHAIVHGRDRQLAGMIRLGWLWTTLLWLVGAALIFIFHERIVRRWELTDPWALVITMLCVLTAIWTPIFSGTMQGRQDFLWLGGLAILGGFCRPVLAAILVVALHLGATGMMVGTLVGMTLGALLGLWRSRDLWTLPREPFDGGELVRQVLPLIFGFGVCQFMFTADTMYAKAFFTGAETAPYVAAGTFSRALLWLVLPLAVVMFPKLVHSNVRAEKTNLLGIVLLGTAVLSICGGLGLWLVGPWAVKLIYKSAWVDSAVALLPWYAGAMVPLALTNVLINDLMARKRFGVVPFLVLLAVAYGLTLPWLLNHVSRRLEVVLQTLTVFNTLMFLVCAWAAFGPAKSANQTAPQSPG